MTGNSMSNESENVLVIDVPGALGGGTVVFTNNSIHFKKNNILYEDVESMSFHAVNTSVNLIPVSQTFSFMIASAKTKISFSIGTSLHIGKKAKREAWAKVAAVSMQLLAPIIVTKLANRIFERNQPVNIGGVTFSKRGYSKSGVFSGNKEVLWSEKIYIPVMKSGVVSLFRDKGGKSKIFTTVKMTVPNAVVIPNLVQVCYNLASVPSVPEVSSAGPDTNPIGMKRCPFCHELIKYEAIVCRYCKRDLPE